MQPSNQHAHASPKVSVILPTYNRAHCVCEAIESVLRQDVPLELIVVDDGSTDQTPELVQDYGPPVRYVRQANRGVSAARNVGLHHARAPWVAFIDSDDEWARQKLAVQFNQVSLAPDAVAHACNLWIDASDGTSTDLLTLRGYHMAPEGQRLGAPLRAALDSCFMVQGLLVRRQACFNAGLFSEHMRIYEDLALITRLAQMGPWMATGQTLASVCRKTSPHESLSALRTTAPVHALANFVRIYQQLLADGNLAPAERRLIEHRLSTAWFDLAGRLENEGRASFARRARWASLEHSPTAAQKVRGAAGLMGLGNLVDLLRQYRQPQLAFTRT